MLELTLETIGKINLLEDEKKALISLIRASEKKGYKLFLFGSRLKGWGADIDILVKGKNITLKDLINLEVVFHKISDTKLDLIPINDKTKSFVKFLERQYGTTIS